MVESLDAPALTADDEHHLVKVLRAREGESVSVIDGTGAWRICEWRSQSLLPIADVAFEAAGQRTTAVAFPPLKHDRSELVVQKLTELGVNRIVLLSVANGIVQWKGEKAVKQKARLDRIIHEAAMQSRRVRLPVLDGPISVAKAVAEGFVLAQWGGEAVGSETSMIAVGSEGGWSPNELALTETFVDLGGTVLRAETAAIAAGVLLNRG